MVTVNNDGKIVGKNVGSAVVTAESVNGKTSSINVEVKEVFIPINDIKINKSSTILRIGESETLTYTISPTDATNKNVTWSSSNTNVATVDSNGKVTAKGVGVAVITVKTSNNIETTINVEVKENTIYVSSVKINESNVSLDKGKSKQLSVTVLPSNATNKTIKWTSSNTNVVTVDNGGKIAGKNIGCAVVTAESVNGKTSSINVEVKEVFIPINDIKLNKSSTILRIGESETITYTISPTNATNKNVTWSSSNTNVATVDSNGKVTALRLGTATITATTRDGGKKATCIINVNKHIEVVFHRNISSSDTVMISQYYTKGNQYNSTTGKGNRFGYTVDGVAVGGTSGQFGKWDKTGYTLLGWSTDKNALTRTYVIYSAVSDNWIDKVLNMGFDSQTQAGKIDLYAVWAKNVDLALFWGQSNMVGSVGAYKEEKLKDTRNLTGLVDQDIISNYTTMSHVDVPIKTGTVLEYKLDSNNKGYLKNIEASTEYIGEKLIYNKNTKKLEYYNSSNKEHTYYSLVRSQGTNMIPQFGKTYYDKTGHTLVAVMAANGGRRISEFLPSTDPGHCSNDVCGEHYIYEALKTKYLEAVKYLETHGYKVKNRFYVVSQGCADTTYSLSSGSLYYDTFMKVHNNMVNDLGIQFGAISETGGRISYLDDKNKSSYVAKINNQQEQLIMNNSKIILGSKLGYNALINRKSELLSFTNVTNSKGEVFDNSIHMTSAALSQIGKESAINVAKNLGY